MLKLPFYGPVRHMKRIGELEEHKALRERNERRLAALKSSNRLTERHYDKPASSRYHTCAERKAIDAKREQFRSDIEWISHNSLKLQLGIGLVDDR
jgi:hypothetical protein